MLGAAAVLWSGLPATMQDRTRHGPQWRTADTYDADIREVFAVLEERTGIGGADRDGLRLYAEAGGLYWFALDLRPGGSGQAVFFALEYGSRPEASKAIGPRVIEIPAPMAAAFLKRLDRRLEGYWGLDTPSDVLVNRNGPLISWERRRGGELFGGSSVAQPGNTYDELSRELRALIAPYLGPGELPDAAWNWPGGSN